LPFANLDVSLGDVPVKWKFEVKEETDLKTPGAPSVDSWWEKVKINDKDHVPLKQDAIQDIWIVCSYSVTKVK
jgi:hypothetical protein